MKYGYFDDNNKEYVITNPLTPYPWINYLGMKDFFSIISNTAGGYCFYKDARLRRITRYRYNNVPLDSGGRYFYIKENDIIWNPGWKPVKTPLDSYECRHGLGYTKLNSLKNDINIQLTFFVPISDNCEIHWLQIKNISKNEKSIKIFSFIEWCLWNALDDMTNFQRNFSTGEVEIEESTIFHKTEYRERRNHYAFYHVNHKINGFDTDRDSFIGIYNGFHEPTVVLEGKSKNSIAHGWTPIASHYLELILKPEETKDLIFILGYIENDPDKKFIDKNIINKEKAYQLIEKYNDINKVRKAFDELKFYWNNLLSKFQLYHEDEKLCRMVNIWNQYQCMVTFNLSRSASYFESGIGRGIGFRDSNQDIIGFVHLIPEAARQRILDLAATQFEDGSAYHQYQPLTKRGNADIGGNFNDDPLWLILSTTTYIKETGDFSILNELVPYNNDENNKGTLFDHLKASFYHVVNNLGPHELPLIGRADWNDCLNLNCFSTNPDESFQTTENKKDGKAESVLIAGMFVLYGNEFIKLCRIIGKNDEAEKAQIHVNKMIEAINKYGWDGKWFLRAYDYYGNKIGSNENEEGKIFIESQGFCVMAGIGKDDGRARLALDSVKDLLSFEYGIVLNQPAYSQYYLNLGEISSYPPGYKENAGVFCHNNPWIMIAETILGNGDQAFDYYKRIAPAYLEDISDLHKTEPYVYSQMVAGKDAYKPGEAKNSWLTGTAAWNFYAISQYILGIKPDYEGIEISPCIPKNWKSYRIKRIFRNKTLIIDIINESGEGKNVKKIILNNNELQTNKVQESQLKENNVIKVFL